MENSNVANVRPDQDPLPDGIFWTPEIERLGRQVAHWVRIDVPGATAYGKMRVGKSSALTYLSETLPSLIGYPVEVVVWEIPQNAGESPREFLQSRMNDSGYPAISHRDIEVLKNRFFQHLEQRCQEKGARRLVVIVDEAQHAKKHHLGCLVEYFNKLTKKGIKPFFLLMGQPELGGAIKWEGVGRDMQIIGRFRVSQYHFRGIALGDLEEVLYEFDRPGPDGPPASLTAYLPQAYANGWRIADLAPSLREALELVMKQHNVQEDIRVPMQYLRSTVGAYLHHAADTGENPGFPSSAALIKCLKESGFLSVLSYYTEPKDDEGGTDEHKQ
ncbi:ATP-binding protein [Paraburkholderia sp. C35]|uniref:ATP-binding protein n=1 Tax=Paraburkholderia sp. C35 TaxID=2126993 RepID=UPI000D6859A9|nr:ATP-binding protein [Paraburkholderia sp. C35]